MKEDYAEINRVNYELFNIELWKEEALSIFQKRIREFQISDRTYDALGGQINIYLERLYDQYFEAGELINMVIENLERSGNMNPMFLTLIKSNISDQLDQLDLRSQIPVFGDQILNEIKASEPFLREYLQSELLRLVLDEGAQRFRDRRVILYNKYDFSTLEETEPFLKSEIEATDAQVSSKIKWLVGLIGLIIILSILFRETYGFKGLIISLSSVSIILLVLGVTLPMIDIDARLDSFSFLLMDEPISFDEQFIYFQSKSILEVTRTLIEGSGVDLKLVGVLVFMFSIVFPFTKLILSALYLFVNRIQSNKVVQTIIFHLGKWSMADVFVVAMFMAYIGFYGIISSQLDSISNSRSGFNIETINYSSLSPGAFFFTSYTLLSICIGILINRKSGTIEN